MKIEMVDFQQIILKSFQIEIIDKKDLSILNSELDFQENSELISKENKYFNN